MIRNKDFALLYAGRAVFNKNGEYAGVVVGWNEEHEGVRGIQFSTDEHGNVQAAYVRGKHGGMKLVSMGDGLENVSSKIWGEKVWGEKVWRH